MSKLVIMKGLPASGKSTHAEEIAQDGNTVRINKDLLRTMLHFDKFTGRNEGMTREAARTLAKHFLADKQMTVIIDDTNLNPRTFQSWKDLATEMGSKTQIEDMTDVPWEECVRRDDIRQNSVGTHIIKNMAMQYRLIEKPSKGWVICDIDGTVADTTHRLHYVRVPEGEKKDWKGFFSEMGNDPVREDVRDIVTDYQRQGYDIVFVSARPDDYRKVTEDWLIENDLSFAFTLLMRRANDKRPDVDVKQEILDRYFDKEDIHQVIDDRPAVIEMWLRNGLDVTDVGKGIDF